MSIFEKHMKIKEKFAGEKTNREDLKHLGEAFVSALLASYDEYLLTNPSLEAIKKTVQDLNSYSQQLMKQFGHLFKK